MKVLHGDHTGRSAGAPLTDLALDYLERMEKKPDDEEKNGVAYLPVTERENRCDL